jgi:YHS domain-containing protein
MMRFVCGSQNRRQQLWDPKKETDLFLITSKERMDKMKNVKQLVLAFLTCMFIVLPALASAASLEYSTVGVGGYDPVAYFKEGKAMKGNGWHVAYHKGVTYVFANKMNRKTFEADPEKYLPAYGGYCAYGVAVGKKFVADPEVWKIVEGTLYLNLDKAIQSKWNEDIPGYIKKADANWPKIMGKTPADL